MKEHNNPEVVIRSRYCSNKIIVHKREIPNDTAQAALSFVDRWGMVAGMPDGEDSSGRQKLRLATPEELVERAFKIATLCFQRARDDGFMIDLPPWSAAEAKE